MRDITKTVVGSFITLFIIILIAYFLFSDVPNFYIFSDSVTIILAVITVLSALTAFKIHGFKSLQGKTLGLISVGLFFWLLGELAWGTEEVLLNIEIEVVSVIDVFYYAGYIFIIAGLIHLWKVTQINLRDKKTLFLLLIIIVVFFAMTYDIMVPGLLNEEISIIERIGTNGYIIVDFVVASLCIIILTSLGKNKALMPWIFVTIGFLVTSVGDTLYAQFSESYLTNASYYIDIFWFIGYIALIFGFYSYKDIITSLSANIKKRN